MTAGGRSFEARNPVRSSAVAVPSRSLPVDKFGESLDRTRVLVLPVTVADRERLGGVTTVG